MSERLNSGFASFEDTAARDSFVTRVLGADPTLKDHAYIPSRRPVIVFERLTSAEQQRLIGSLDGVGRWVDDVQFKTMN